ncbi:kinase-like domain-containing protein [Paraphoma chrysanthemicola]|nr:kinase-like domain-containing protein [Paraphoma chrysanthemicola]
MSTAFVTDSKSQNVETMADIRFMSIRATSAVKYRILPSSSRHAITSSTSQAATNWSYMPQLRCMRFYGSLTPLPSDLAPHDDFVRRIMNESDEQGWCPPNTIASSTIRSIFMNRGRSLVASTNTSLETLALMAEMMVRDICEALLPATDCQTDRWDRFKSVVARHAIDFIAHVCNLVYLTPQLDLCFQKVSTCPLADKSIDVSSSQWLAHLKTRGLLPNESDELDWSGRGQHVEYDSRAEKTIPLVPERSLGHSATALVDSVLCRRIRLARKRIRCTRTLRKEDCVTEVEHLQKLQHAHILRVVGTYTFKKDLAILLYPVCPWNLEEFMDELVDPKSDIHEDFLEPPLARVNFVGRSLSGAFGCLAHAMAFIHEKNVKHMDIKPKNILVRPFNGGPIAYKVYIADFGIARSYTAAADAETDSPVSFTKAYAAPEVALQDRRGFSVDIFSLGCVFLEMLATMNSNRYMNERQTLIDLRSSSTDDSSYHANMNRLLEWLRDISETPYSKSYLSERQLRTFPKMIEKLPQNRPSAAELDKEFVNLRCVHCDEGREPFEMADELP